jgi:NAD(P)H-dependent FMN reductase
LPLYDGDLEASEGMPANAMRLRELFLAHDALLVASPENNASVSSLLKNTLDWLSRSIGDGKGANAGTAPYAGKTALLLSASPGGFGGVRGLPHLRQILATLGVTVLGVQVSLPRAHEAFDEHGALKDARAVEAATRQLAEASRRLAA